MGFLFFALGRGKGLFRHLEFGLLMPGILRVCSESLNGRSVLLPRFSRLVMWGLGKLSAFGFWGTIAFICGIRSCLRFFNRVRLGREYQISWFIDPWNFYYFILLFVQFHHLSISIIFIMRWWFLKPDSIWYSNYPNKFDKLHKFDIIGDNFRELWIMPAIPLSNSHSKCIDIFI